MNETESATEVSWFISAALHAKTLHGDNSERIVSHFAAINLRNGVNLWTDE